MDEKLPVGILQKRVDELEKKIAEYQAQNNDEKYRILFEKSKDAILVIENGRFSDCNQATVDMLGYKDKNDIIQSQPSDLSPVYQPDGKDSVAKAGEMIDIALKTGSHRFEWDHIRANGEVFPVEVLLTTISNKDDNLIIHTIWRDITDRKEAEKLRLKEKETLSTILESTPLGIVLIDTDGRCLYVNPYFSKITGYSLDDVPTKDEWFKLAYPDENDRQTAFNAWHSDSRQSNFGKSREFKITCKNGQIKYIEFRSTFLKDLKISVLTDVTARKESEEMIREKDRLQGVLELSGAVCHEMNQPLMSIQGYFDLILMDIAMDDPIYPKIEKIKFQIDRLSNITKKLMEISRYETKEYLKEKIVDLGKASAVKG